MWHTSVCSTLQIRCHGKQSAHPCGKDIFFLMHRTILHAELDKGSSCIMSSFLHQAA